MNSGGTLGGTGSIAGTVNVTAGGIVAPGVGGAGTLSTGHLSFNNTSVLSFDLGTNRDSIIVNGNLILDGLLDVMRNCRFRSRHILSDKIFRDIN